MSDNEVTIFAETTFRNKRQKFGIKKDDRRRHMYLIGKTGMGKSTILENMIVEDIRAGRGVAVVDPHGDLAEKVIQYIPNNRINDVIYFNPSDFDYPIAFNVVEHVEPQFRHLVASGLIGVFKKLWADSWGPRLEYILRNTILAILDYPGSTLLAVIRMLSDKKFRKKVIEKIQDPVVKSFWVNEFAGYADKFASEAVSPIQNKVGQFLSTSLIRNIIGQVKSTIDMRKIMDEGKILILNLSKGRIGEDSSSLLGSMMITKIQLAAMSRVDIPENERRDFYLYIDEFQNFTTESFANILSEARKYRLNLIMAHQYIEQLGEIVKPAVFGNVGTLIVHRVGAADAEELVQEFAPVFTEEDIVNLPKYEIYLKLMIDGIASEPFSARGLAPLSKEEVEGNLEKVISVSRERYARERAAVEEKIARWHSNDEDEEREEGNGGRNIANSAPAAHFHAKNEKTDDDDVYKFATACSRCGRETKTSFKPDGIRPVYCKDCLSLAREEKKREIEDRKKAKDEELSRLEAVSVPAPVYPDPGERSGPKAPFVRNEPVRPSPLPPPRPDDQKPEENGLSLREVLKIEPVKFSQAVKEAGRAPVNLSPERKNVFPARPETNYRQDHQPQPRYASNNRGYGQRPYVNREEPRRDNRATGYNQRPRQNNPEPKRENYVPTNRNYRAENDRKGAGNNGEGELKEGENIEM
ncbi:MAG: type IV secretion system DNA-binding domain-containing protein [Candidatus Falkowbacteria bacterium]